MGQLQLFKEYSVKTATDFLQTVVVLDDELGFSPRIDILTDESIDITEPDESIWNNSDNKQNQYINNNTDSQHPLDYHALSFNFAKKGLVCSGLKPLKNQDTQEVIDSAFIAIEKSDLCILDWEMKGTKGDITKEIISKLAKNDFSSGGKLRFITIYTGVSQKDWEDLIISPIYEHLKNSESHLKNFKIIKNSPYIDIVPDGESTYWRVFIISKNETLEQDLPEELVCEFSKLTSGLLSNATLASISEVRNQTSKILAKYNSDLDLAYISHILGLISLPDSREYAHEIAFDYAVNLISEEIKSQLQISPVVKKSLEKEYVAAWPEFYLHNKTEQNYFLQIQGNPIICEPKKLKKILSASTEDELVNILHQLEIPNKIDNKIKELSELIAKSTDSDEDIISKIISEKNVFGKPEDIGKIFKKNAISVLIKKGDYSANLKLCSHESTRRNFRNIKDNEFTSLKLGTILKNNNEFYICIQPLCDSVRLKSVSSFIFLKASSSSNHYNYVIESQSGNRHEKIKVSFDSSKVINMNFGYDSKRNMVIGEKIEEKIFFKTECYHKSINSSDAEKLNLEWVGELKEGAAQKIVNQITAQISRVGLDEFEWLRTRNQP
ncbi:response regulator receiver domain [Yersinia enterocolitica]|uniref:response regulator receiver domain n=1 Tax=Yersinia enterocolitica TaxID=630 RepID=UPI00398D0DCA